jgi:hypothetical protein
MTRSQRLFHRRIWPLLAIILAMGIALALILHVPPA